MMFSEVIKKNICFLVLFSTIGLLTTPANAMDRGSRGGGSRGGGSRGGSQGMRSRSMQSGGGSQSMRSGSMRSSGGSRSAVSQGRSTRSVATTSQRSSRPTVSRGDVSRAGRSSSRPVRTREAQPSSTRHVNVVQPGEIQSPSTRHVNVVQPGEIQGTSRGTVPTTTRTSGVTTAEPTTTRTGGVTTTEAGSRARQRAGQLSPAGRSDVTGRRGDRIRAGRGDGRGRRDNLRNRNWAYRHGHRHYYRNRYYRYPWWDYWYGPRFSFWLSYPIAYQSYYTEYSDSCRIFNDTDSDMTVYTSNTPRLTLPSGQGLYLPCNSSVTIESVLGTTTADVFDQMVVTDDGEGLIVDEE